MRLRVDSCEKVQREVLELIARGAPLPVVLDKLAAMVETCAPGTQAMIWLEVPEGRLELAAAPGETALATESPRDRSRQTTESGGAWSCPIRDTRSAMVGVLTLRFAEPRPADPQLVRLAETAAKLAGIAVSRQRAEDEIRRQKNELEQAYEQLLAAHQAKDEFLSIVSHELRNPLHIIFGYLGLLTAGLSPPLTAEQETFLQEIRTGAERMHRLVNDLLDMASIQAGKFAISARPTSLSAVVEESCRAAMPRARAAGLELGWRVAPELMVDGDDDRLCQIFSNLLANAMKFTPPGGRIEVDVRGDSDVVRAEVRDTGSGIPAEALTRLFKPFHQVDDQGRRFGGVGLGLSICQSIVSAHGGDLGVESRPGEGSTFWLTLPRWRPAESEASGPSTEPDRNAADDSRLAG